MLNKDKISRWLGSVIIALVAILVAANILYIKVACLTRQCFVINIAITLLLIWAIAFWFVVLRHSKKD